MIKATCPLCGRKKSVPLRLSGDNGDLAVESSPCENCRYELTEKEMTEKVNILVDSVMRQTRVPRLEAFTRTLALMMP